MFDYKTLSRSIVDVLNKKLFFIGGTIKSGTTWLQLILDGHPRIACRGEGHFVNYLATSLQQAVSDYNGRISDKNNKIFNEVEGFPLLERDHLMFLLASSVGLQLSAYGSSREFTAVGEKTPDNIRAFPLLHQLFPGARFVHIIRDGRDVAVSGWFHNLRVSPEWTKNNFSNLSAYVEHFAPVWVGEVEAGRQFGKIHPEYYFELRYEDLKSDATCSVARLLEFIGVDASDEAVEQCVHAGDFKRLSGGRTAGEEDRDSHFRKGMVGDWHNHFDAASSAAFQKHAGALLLDMGYE